MRKEKKNKLGIIAVIIVLAIVILILLNVNTINNTFFGGTLFGGEKNNSFTDNNLEQISTSIDDKFENKGIGQNETMPITNDSMGDIENQISLPSEEIEPSSFNDACIDKCKSMKTECEKSGLDVNPTGSGCLPVNSPQILTDGNCETNCFAV